MSNYKRASVYSVHSTGLTVAWNENNQEKASGCEERGNLVKSPNLSEVFPCVLWEFSVLIEIKKVSRLVFKIKFGKFCSKWVGVRECTLVLSFCGFEIFGRFFKIKREGNFLQRAVFAIGSRIVFGYLFMNLLKRKSELFLDIYLWVCERENQNCELEIFFEKVGKHIRKFFEVWNFLLYLFNFIFLLCFFGVCFATLSGGSVGDAPFRWRS